MPVTPASSTALAAASLFDVIGDGSPFVRHVGLFIGHVSAQVAGGHAAANIEVIDMGPPLPSGQPMHADVIGTAALTADEQQKIRTFVDRHVLEHQALKTLGLTLANLSKGYCICPHAAALTEADGRCVRMKFSCAGFVFEAYRFANIHLIDEQRLPSVDLSMIQKAYPAFSSFLNRPVMRVALGLSEVGPWPIMLCGYLFHALARSSQLIRQTPHIAQPGQEQFP